MVHEENGPLRRRLQELCGQLPLGAAWHIQPGARVGAEVEADVAFSELGLSSGAAVILRDELQRVARQWVGLEGMLSRP